MLNSKRLPCILLFLILVITANAQKGILPAIVTKQSKPTDKLPDFKRQHTVVTAADLDQINKAQKINICDFDTAKFISDAEFNSLVFMKKASFDSARFMHQLTVYQCFFEENADFAEITMADYAYITDSWFDKNVFFNYAVFHKFLSLSSLEPGDSTKFNFSYAVLPNLINFSRNKELLKPVNFIDADFSRKDVYNQQNRGWHYINLYQTDPSKIKIDYQHFRLCFYNNKKFDSGLATNFKYDKNKNTLVINNKSYSFDDKNLQNSLLANKEFQTYLKVIFPSADINDPVIGIFMDVCISANGFPQRLSEDETFSIYDGVLKTFDLSGQKNSYELLNIEYQDFKKHGWFNIPHIWNLHNYRKEWIFFWAGGFLFLFTIITFCFYNKLNKTLAEDGVYYIATMPSPILISSPRNFFKRFWCAVFYTCSLFFIIGLKLENINFKKFGVVYILFVYSIGIMCLGYLANFILQK